VVAEKEDVKTQKEMICLDQNPIEGGDCGVGNHNPPWHRPRAEIPFAFSVSSTLQNRASHPARQKKDIES
jgi:hypothetical protein